MSVLASLARAYGRLPDAPPFGFSQEKIGFLISLNADGSVASFTDLREGEGAKRRPRMIPVPQPVKRTAGIAPNFLWDKTSYVLGVTAGEGKRTGEEHAAFVERHEKAMAGLDDEGLRALLAFLAAWSADQFVERPSERLAGGHGLDAAPSSAAGRKRRRPGPSSSASRAIGCAT